MRPRFKDVLRSSTHKGLAAETNPGPSCIDFGLRHLQHEEILVFDPEGKSRLVRKGGLEPPPLAGPDPKSGESKTA